MNTVEEAYSAIGGALLSSVTGGWDALLFTAVILDKDCSSMRTSQLVNTELKSIGLGFKNGFVANDAALYLRDDFLRTTGDRIWGLTFTLYPTGKFKIEYDYNKPEGYVETDETISVGDALSSLQTIVGKDNLKL